MAYARAAVANLYKLAKLMGVPFRTAAKYTGQTNINAGLVAWLKLDENTGTTANDSSGNSNTGTLINTPTWATGKLNSAIQLNGSNQTVDLAEPPAASTNINTGTIAAWIKTSGAGSGFRGIALKPLAYGMFLYDNWLVTWNGGPGATANSGSLGDGAWHHVAVTFEFGVDNGCDFWLDGAHIGAYIDAVLYDHFRVDLQSHEDGLVIGAGQNPAVNSFFNGIIDDVRVYNRKLSAADMAALYAVTAP